MHIIPVLTLAISLVAAQDFVWLNTELSQVISYEALHYTQCYSYPNVCPPVTSSCASTLCENCPKYYHTCCLSAANIVSCFQSIHNQAIGSATLSSAVVGVSSRVPTTTGAAVIGLTTNVIGSVTTAVSNVAVPSQGESVTPAATFPITTMNPSTTVLTSIKTGKSNKDQMNVAMIFTFSVAVLFMA